MAGQSLVWSKPLAVAALLAGACCGCCGQAAPAGQVGQAAGTGSLTGKLTDLHSAPLGGVAVCLRDRANGAAACATTQRNGTYRFTGLGAGEYTLAAESPALGRAEVGGIVVAQGREARVQSAVQFEAVEAPAVVSLEAVERAAEAILPRAGDLLQTAASGELALRAFLEKPRPMPAVASVPASGVMEAEAIELFQVAARRLPEPPREKPQTAIVVLNAVLGDEPLHSLQLSGRGWPAVEPPVAAGVNAIAGAGNGGPVVQPAVGERPAATVFSAGARQDSVRSGPGMASARAIAMGAEVALALRTVAESALHPARPVHVAWSNGKPLSPATTPTETAAHLEALPSNGRRWQEFLLDKPTSSTRVGEDGPVASQGVESSSISVDGAARSLAFGGGGRTGGGWQGGRGSVLSQAAVREVETTIGTAEASAERAAGGSTRVNSLRGANGLHGQGFLFDRQNSWDARNPFTQWVKETAAGTATTTPVFTPEAYSPADAEMNWGIGVGGHIRRDRLFWFGAIDSLRRDDAAVSTVKHPDQFFAQPTNDEMQVLGSRLGLSSLNPVVAGLGAYVPMLETLAALLGPAQRSTRQWTGFARIDWEAGEHHRFTLEGTGADSNSPGGGLTRVSETNGNHSFGSSQAREEWLLGRWEAFLTSNLLAVTQASIGDTVLSARPNTPSAYEQTLVQPAWGQLPQITVDQRYGMTIGNPARFGQGRYPEEHLYQGQETVDWVRGNLLVKAGADTRHNADRTTLLRNQTGTYSYANVENFISDALTFAAYGLSGQLDPIAQHNCDATGKVWRDSTNQLHGRGSLPCYSYYSQSMGPTDWRLSTNDLAGYVTAQWQPAKRLAVSAGLRWEREQLPPAMTALDNPELPLTQQMPHLGNDWGPRLSVAWGGGETHWPVLRLGFGTYYGRTQNATLENVITQTGSLKGDLNFFMRPTDNLNAGGAPPFPYVLAGEPATVVKPGAVMFAPEFRNSEIHQAVTAVEETLPGHMQVTASAVLSLGRRLPVSIDTNLDPAVNPKTITYEVVDASGKGPLKGPKMTVPFYASWPSATSATGFDGRLNPDYQQVVEVMGRANSTYEAAIVKVERYGRKGLSFDAHYTYAHAMDWNPNESSQVSGSDVLDPAKFAQEYGTSDLDVRHSASATVILEAPWKLHRLAGQVANGWRLSGVGHFRSGMPFTMRTAASLAREFDTTGAAIVGLGQGMNGSGGDNRVYGVGRNTYRYQRTWKADLRLGKRFDLGHMRELEVLAESFNLFNHQNVTEVETVGYYLSAGTVEGGLPTLTYLTGLKPDTTEFGMPLNVNATDSYRERQIQVGMRVRF